MGRYLTDADLGDLAPASAPDAAPSRYLTDAQADIPAAPAAPKSAGAIAQLERQLGLTARLGLHALGTSAGGWITDPILTAANGLGAHLGTSQNAADAIGDFIGLPRPANKVEQAVDMIGTAAGGSAGVARTLQGLANAASRAPNVAQALNSTAGSISANPAAAVGGAATGTGAAALADNYAANHGYGPVRRTLTDMIAATAGGLPGSAIASKFANGAPMLTRNGILPGAAATPQQQQVIDAAGRAGVPLMAQDVGGPGGWWGSIAKVMQKAPFGNIGPKATAAAQNDAIKNGLNAMADQYTPAGLGTRYATVDQLVADDLRNQYAGAKRNVGTAFDSVQNALAANPGAEQIQLPRTRAAAQQLMSEYPNVFDDLNTDASARRAVTSIMGGTGPQNSPILQTNGTSFQNAPTITYNDARALSKSLGHMLSQSQKQAASGASSEAQTAMIARLYRALNGDGVPGSGGDIGDWAANAPPGVGGLHYTALDAFKNQVLPFRADPQMYRLVSSRTPSADYDLAAQGTYNNYFNAAQTERAPYALSLMSPEAQSAVTYQALRNAASKGAPTTSPGVGVSAGSRSLDEHNAVLANILASTGGADQTAADMRTLLNLGRSSNDILADPKNGSRLAGLGALSATAGAAAAASHFLDTSPAVVVPAALAGTAGVANGFHALSRYLPKSMIFAAPGNTLTNSLGPMFAIDQTQARPMPADPDDPGLGLLMPQ